MQSIDDCMPVPESPDDLFKIRDTMLDPLFYDLSYFPGYSLGDTWENTPELGDATFYVRLSVVK